MSVEPLPEEEVHVWTVIPDQIRDPALLRAYHELMTPDEVTKQQRYAFEKGRHECLVTRALVRTTLSRYVDRLPEDWRFEKNEHGRPALVPDQRERPLHFNLSHTDGLIACAVTVGREVGVDVEWRDRRTETVAIADRFFSPFEVRALHAVPAEGQRRRFFEYWTLKESYIKARGKGLAIPLDQFSFHLDDGDPIRISFDPQLADDPRHWQFLLHDPDPTHQLAVGVERGRREDLKIRIRSTVPLRH